MRRGEYRRRLRRQLRRVRTLRTKPSEAKCVIPSLEEEVAKLETLMLTSLRRTDRRDGLLEIESQLDVVLQIAELSDVTARSRQVGGTAEAKPYNPEGGDPIGSFILRLIVSRRESAELLGDFSEFYADLCEAELSNWKVHTIYWKELALSLCPLLWARIKPLRRLLAALGIGDYIRRLLS